MSLHTNNINKTASFIPADNLFLQSDCLYLQSAGSKGENSTAGIHLRWTLKGPLEEHLPKGDYFQQNPEGFNKPDDFVVIYRTPYNPNITTLFLKDPPSTVIDSEGLWLYGSKEEKAFYVYFRNLSKYQQVRASTDPFSDPVSFFNEYGNNIIEVECKEMLFFAAKLEASATGSAKTEILSVEANKLSLPKNVTFRKNITDFSEKIFAENSRSVRFVPINCIIERIDFEFYDNFFYRAAWEELGKYSLLTDDDEVLYRRLDPDPGNHPVHAIWARYNDGEYVNIKNYHQKWSDLPDKRNTIKESVEQYLKRSDDPWNPLALETYYLNDDDLSQPLEVSHLAILQMASLDYHVARMLGLGCLDISDQIYDSSQYVYAAQYVTLADLNNGQGAMEITHFYISLPTALDDQRPCLPVILKEPVPGIISADPTAGASTSGITDADGYTHDGTGRYISLLAEELTPDEPQNSSFYFSDAEFDMSKFTYPVYVGIEYRNIEEILWRLPELPNDPHYQNVTSNGDISYNETVAVAVPDFGVPAYVHKETKSGRHVYGSYGVNWFSRAQSSFVTWEVESAIKPSNILLPPSSINAFLIQEEQPLLLTSQNEQDLLAQNPYQDKTLVRLTFEYDAAQDMISYQKAINGEQLTNFNPLPDHEELFADEIEIFFRPEIPKQVFGMIATIADLPGNPLVSVVQTKDLPLSSASQSLSPNIPSNQFQNYIGGIFKVGNDEYIIHNILTGPTPDHPVFHILKKQIGNAFGQNTNIPFDPANFVVPVADDAFMVVENMQNITTWGMVNPHQVKMKIGNNWPIHTEEITIESGQGSDITYNTYFRKFRGIVQNAVIAEYTDQFTPQFSGLYKINFQSFVLNNHPQFSNVPGADSIQWYRGSLRVTKESDPNGEKKTLKVIRIDNIGNGNLEVYALDETYQTDPIQASGTARLTQVNFYPGYRAYVYYNAPCRLTKENILPQDPDALEKYSIFGLRASDLQYSYKSKISTPSLLFAKKIEAPLMPEMPLGAKYATRPDSFGRSTYAFTTQYLHKPFSVTFLRNNDDILLTSLYKLTNGYSADPEIDSVEDIRIKNNDDYFNARLLDLANATIDLATNKFKEYNGYALPIPNNPRFFDSINNFIDEHNGFYQENLPHISQSQVTTMNYIVIPADSNGKYGELKFYDFVKQTVQNTYVPLTEVPIIYQYIKGGSYQPIPKAQVIRDRNGTLLNPTSPEFDMAPMMKILGISPHKTLFLDYTLDGASTSVYFYAVKETNAQMVQSELSPAVGPVRMVNSFPLRTPEIRSVIPVLSNTTMNNTPEMKVDINSYGEIYHVKKAKLYRALNMADATSIRTMALVKELDLEEAVLQDEIWSIEDNFSDLQAVPYSDPLYYKVTVEAEVEYANANYDGQSDVIVTEYAPSEASKLMITTIPDNVVPGSPELKFESDPVTGNVVTSGLLSWEEQCYKGKYHLYKLSSQGNWKEIARMNILPSNISEVQLYLFENDAVTGEEGWILKETSSINNKIIFLQLNKIGLDPLIIKDVEGNPIYHHFKVVTENTSGMYSNEDKILTIYSNDNWEDIGGISSDGTTGMIIEQTFIVKPN